MKRLRALGTRYQGMTAEWHREHEQAFQRLKTRLRDDFTAVLNVKNGPAITIGMNRKDSVLETLPVKTLNHSRRGQKMVADIEAKAAARRCLMAI